MRKDLYLYNEACGWILTSAGLNGRYARPIEREEWDAEFERGTFIPIELVQDDPLILRVVVNEALTEAEEEEWIDRFEWKLAVPDGQLLLAAGSEYLECPDDENNEEYLQRVEIPPGDYLAEVYTFIHSVNGPDDAEGLDEKSFRAYWRRTRKGEKMPAWLRRMDDEDYEGEDEDESHFIEFLVRLSPVEREPERPEMRRGWVAIGNARRTPERCPRGITSTEVAGLTDREEPVQTDLHYTHRVPELVADLEPRPVAGGPVAIPVRELVLPYWLSWFCGETHPYVRVFNGPQDFAIHWPGFLTGIKESPTADGWRIDIEGMNARFTQFGHLRQVGELLAALPDGAGLELAAADNISEDQVGFQRFIGTVRGGAWSIERTYPPVSRADLEAMLQLARETEAGEAIRLRDREEGEQVMEAIRARDFLLRQDPPRVQGLSLKLKKADAHLMPFLGARVFLERFPQVWPVMDRDDELDQWDSMMDRIAEAGAARATGDTVFDGRFARYTRADMEALETVDQERVAAVTAAMEALGFRLLGDLNSTQTFAAVFRGYGKEGSPVYGDIITNGYGSFAVDFYTVFDDGFSLTTAEGEGFERDRRTKAYRLLAPGDEADRLRAHEAKIAELASKHGGPRLAAPALDAFAAAVDDYLVRMHG